MDPLDADGGPLAHDVLRWSLAQTLRYRAGMALADADEGRVPDGTLERLHDRLRRAGYVRALRAADDHDIDPLLAFARS